MSNKTDNAADVEFTRGPWVACIDVTAAVTPGHIIKADYGAFTPIAMLWKGRGQKQEANARLIAAGPDLLAACESVMAASVGVNGGKPYDGEPEWITKTRAAIAKARGQ